MMDRHSPHTTGDSPTEVAADLREAALAFFPEATSIGPVPISDDLARVEDGSGVWCVRRWPAGVPATRVRFVHAVLLEARRAGLRVVPGVAETSAGERRDVIAAGGRLFDAQGWLPGRPLGRRVVETALSGMRVNLPGTLPGVPLQDLIETVARFHIASESLALRVDAPRAPLSAVAASVWRSWSGHRERLRAAASRNPPVQRWIRVSERALPAAAAALEAAPEQWTGLSVVGHHDLWPAHVLFSRRDEDERLTGLVDFTDVAAGSPLLDLAHLVAHFGGWSADAAEAALGTYGAVRAVTPEERRLLPTVVALDLVAEAGWLLVVANEPRGREDPPVSSALRTGAEALLASLEAVTPVVLRGEDKRVPGVRKWVHRARPEPKRPGISGAPDGRAGRRSGNPPGPGSPSRGRSTPMSPSSPRRPRKPGPV